LTDSNSSDDLQPRDAAYWAQHVSTLRLSQVPTGALNLNVEGRRMIGPLQGFGRLWQKTYRVRLPGVTPTPSEVIQIWKENFPRFVPKQQRFYPALAGVEPGEIILINATLEGMPVNTGVVVLYADDEAFTLMTPQGHPESGWVTFSACVEDGCTVCQVQSLARANDPLYEVSFRLFASTAQEHIWRGVLTALAAYFQVNDPEVQMDKICVDPRVQWSEARNIWQNAAVRSLLYMFGLPLRLLGRRFSRRQRATGSMNEAPDRPIHGPGG